MVGAKMTAVEILAAIVVAGLIIPLLCGCVFVPKEVEESIHSLHKGNVLVGAEYTDLLIRFENEETRNAKLLLLQRHLELSKELDTWVTGRGQ